MRSTSTPITLLTPRTAPDTLGREPQGDNRQPDPDAHRAAERVPWKFQMLVAAVTPARVWRGSMAAAPRPSGARRSRRRPRTVRRQGSRSAPALARPPAREPDEELQPRLGGEEEPEPGRRGLTPLTNADTTPTRPNAASAHRAVGKRVRRSTHTAAVRTTSAARNSSSARPSVVVSCSARRRARWRPGRTGRRQGPSRRGPAATRTRLRSPRRAARWRSVSQRGPVVVPGASWDRCMRSGWPIASHPA